MGCLRATIGRINPSSLVVSKMAGEPTRTQAQSQPPEAGTFREWYVVTGGGASAFRMTPGLTVGETDSGTLALNDRTAAQQWVEFVLADDGEPWASIVTRDRSLRVDGHDCLRHPLGVGATLRLPNNTLHISHDIGMPELSGLVVEVVHRDIPQRVQDLVGPGLEEALAAIREPEPEPPETEMPDLPDLADLADLTEPAPREQHARAEPDRAAAEEEWPDPLLTTAEPRPHARRRSPVRRQNRVAVMTGVLAVLSVTAVTVVVLLFGGAETNRISNFDPIPLEPPPAGTSADAPAAPVDRAPPIDRPAPVADEPPAPPAELADRQGARSFAPPPPIAEGPDAAAPAAALAEAASGTAAPEPADAGPSPAAEVGSPSEPVAAEPETPVAARPEPELEEPAPVATRPEPEPEPSAPAEEPVPAPQVSQNTDTPAETAATPAAGPDPALLAELEQTGLQVQALAVELARRRDLHAAHLALAQGRLTTPPDGSAYALFSRVLAADPGSPEAAAGLQAVRQALINRALAQLAGGELDDAYRTLQAAAEAGADAGLVADLLAEVEYRAGTLGSER